MKGNELDQPAIAPDEQMRRNADAGESSQTGGLPREQPPQEQVFDSGTAKLAGWQADAMDDDQRNRHPGRPAIAESTRPEGRPPQAPAGNIDFH